MKKNIIIISLFFLIIIVIISCSIINKQIINSNANSNNKEFEKYTEVTITGTELITVINKAIDKNEKLNINKNSNGKYINNSKNSINIEVKFLEKDELVDMESINKLGIESFIKYYSTKKFKCEEIKYHNNSKNICYLKFEEINT